MSDRKDVDRTGLSGRGPTAFVFLAKLVFAWGFVVGIFVVASPGASAQAIDPEVECLALTIYFEARGEPDEGKLAVGQVVMNRASHPLFPKKVCEVVQQGGEKIRYRCQFTWWCDGRSDEPTNARVWSEIKSLASRVYQRSLPDPTDGALWYHTVDVSPGWRRRLTEGARIGRHIFYQGGDRPRAKTTRVAKKGPPAPPQDPKLQALPPATTPVSIGPQEALGGAPSAHRNAQLRQGPISACRWC